MFQRGSDRRDNNPKVGNTSRNLSSFASHASEESKSLIPSISLPKGGGAIKGIDEKFSVNPVTGTASLSIPIFTTPGRSDFYPKLSLDYDSGGGNGPFGLGWNLSIPSIARKTDKGLPRYQDEEESDTYVLSGAEDLVPALIHDEQGNWQRDIKDSVQDKVHGKKVDDEAEYTVCRYRARIEGLFARIERWQNKATGDVHWRSISKDNVTSIYGKSPASRIADPEDGSRVFKWLLEESYDDKGNIIIYEYKQENQENIDPSLPQEKNRLTNNNSYANRYLKRIKYANKTSFRVTAPQLPSDWLMQVVFDYGEHHLEQPEIEGSQSWPARQDGFSSFRAGFEIRTQRLCHRVLMFHHFEELGNTPCLVRSTEFTYQEDPVLTYLTSVTQRGYRRKEETGEYINKSLPPLEFNYTEFQVNEKIEAIDAESLENLPIGLDGVQYQWVDLDGEGIAGILTEQADAWFYKRSLGNGRFGPLQRVATMPSLGSLRTGRAQVMDLAGDGQKDLVLLDEPLAGFYERKEENCWDSFVPFVSSPKINWRDPNLRLVDLNGDGHADILITEDEVFTWHPSRAEEGFGPAESVCKETDEDRGPALVFADATQSIYLADMAGDGLTDIVRIRNGEVCYWPNLGYGRFGAKVTMDDAPYFDSPDQFSQERIRLADIDGSGTTDIIYLGANGISFWRNQSGNSWSAPHHLTSFPSTENLSSVTVVDLLGNGTACIVWSSPLPGEADEPMRYVDLMAEGKPHLLQSVVNNMGAETGLQYASSTKFYLEDLDAGKPWITKLPFPVHVVERVETRELVTGTKLVTLYKYHHGYFDGEDREFRGFGMVEQWDTESFAQFNEARSFDTPPNSVEKRLYAMPAYTKTWLHTGFYRDRNNISQQYAEEYYQGDPQATLLQDTVLPPEEMSAKEEHEACRALKGRILRQEIYGLDESEQSRHPYQVTERNYQLKLIQPIHEGSHAVAYAHERETLDYYYERKPDDPRTSHRLILEMDYDSGNVTKSVAIGYRRRSPAFPEQEKPLITYIESDFINLNDPDEMSFYRVGIPYEVRTYEIIGKYPEGIQPFEFSEIQNAVQGAYPIPYEMEPNTDLIQRRLIESTRTLYYKNDLFGALELGVVESLALPYKTYQIVFTPGLLTHVYGNRINDNLLRDEGKYLKSKDLKDEGLFPNDDMDDIWWIPSDRQIFDPAHFYLPLQTIDPFEQVFISTYDAYDMLILGTKDPLHNTVSSENDYRIMQPWLVTDPNGNRSAVEFNELGMVVATAVMGKESESVPEKMGDTLEDPTTRLEYELYSWMKPIEDRGPNYVHTLAREDHSSINPNSRWQESYSYSDGLGREVMQKIQAEPGMAPGRDENGELLRDSNGNLIWVDTSPNVRWVGTGRTVFDNKGNPVKQYEPFFDSAHVYVDEDDLVEWGITPILNYDPLGRLIRTDSPNDTFSKVEFDAWQQKSWDENDTVIIKNEDGTVTESQWYAERKELPSTDPEGRAAKLAAKHADTPGIAHLDVLGRTFNTIAKNTILDDDGNVAEIVEYQTHTQLDIEGNPLIITDARNNAVMTYMAESEDENGDEILVPAYDIAGQQLYQKSMDAGERWNLNNVAGNPIRTWDSREHQIRHVYDALQRPTHLFVRQKNQTEWLAEHTIYGEDYDTPKLYNLRGNVYQQYDGAGVVTNKEFDFKGNLLVQSRQLAKQYNDNVDWLQTQDLEDEVFTSRTEYDALNRTTRLISPHTGEIPLSEIRPIYNEANLLEQVEVRLRDSTDWAPFVTNIDYNSKGQRKLIEYANNIKTEYSYDAETFRLTNLKTTKTTNNKKMQDLYYTYDPVGNITEIRDEAQQTIYYDNEEVLPVSKYEYDALYQLILASGREHAGQNANNQPDHNDFPTVENPHPNDPQAMHSYTEKYAYDEVGNILNMIHQAANGGWTRYYDNPAESNRLRSTSLPADDPEVKPYSAQYEYDPHGNIIEMPHLPAMDWDFKDQLHGVQTQVVKNGETPEKAYYVYDAAGQRVRKVWVKNNGSAKEERFYFGGFEIYRRWNGDNLTKETEILHIMDDQKRIALVETNNRNNGRTKDNPEPVFCYQIDNHLGSSSLELDEFGNVISYEEYYPYGSTSYQAGQNEAEVSLKRYRYIGKERDDETGLYYYGARYYAAWLGRWTRCDPVGLVDSLNLYTYTSNNPIRFLDNEGTQISNPEIEQTKSEPVRDIVKKIRELEESGNPKPADLLLYWRAGDARMPLFLEDKRIWFHPLSEQEKEEIERLKKEGVEFYGEEFFLGFAYGPVRNYIEGYIRYSNRLIIKNYYQKKWTFSNLARRKEAKLLPYLFVGTAEILTLIVGGMPRPRTPPVAGTVQRISKKKYSKPGFGRYNIAPHGKQPKPRAAYHSHHFERKKELVANISEFKPEEVPTILLEGTEHTGVVTPIQRKHTSLPGYPEQMGTSLNIERVFKELKLINVPAQIQIWGVLLHTGYLFSRVPLSDVLRRLPK